jgi:hypothetical protein
MMGCLTTVIGLGLAIFVIFNVVTNWNEVTTKEHLLELLLPAWLTLGFLAFLYLIGVMVAYQSAFNRIKWTLRDRKQRVWQVQLAMVSVQSSPQAASSPAPSSRCKLPRRGGQESPSASGDRTTTYRDPAGSSARRYRTLNSQRKERVGTLLLPHSPGWPQIDS